MAELLEKTLVDFDRKRIDVSTNPIPVESYFIKRVPQKHAKSLWKASCQKKQHSSITKMKSESWLELEPLRDKYGNIECFDRYYERIKLKTKFSHIPKKVFNQWLWAHHDKEESITNYGWLDYGNIDFKLCRWENKQLKDMYVIERYRDYYQNRASYDDLNSFCCIDKDIQEWERNGTWRTPPIILDVQTLPEEIPKWSELVSPYQLVEGHSRLGYLHSMFRIDKLGKGKVAKKHQIYLMRFNCRNA